jgi:hypothetical protein
VKQRNSGTKGPDMFKTTMIHLADINDRRQS